MAIETQCRCGHVMKVKDELKGKHIRCLECKQAHTVKPRRFPRLKKTRTERPKRSRESATKATPSYSAPPSRPPRPKPAPKRKKKRKQTAAQGESGNGSKIVAALFVVLSVAGFVAKLAVRLNRHFPLNESSASSGTDDSGSIASMLGLGNSLVSSPYDLTGVPLPTFPDLPAPALTLSGVNVYQFSLAGDKDLPGAQATMRVYIPQDAVADHSRTCVLVAPAGSNLIVGNSIDGMDYHDETLPYAVNGCVVVMYSLDGTGPSELHDDIMTGIMYKIGYSDFMKARAGLVNARNAMEYVLAKLPQVDPTKIYSAGHSSAGTLSLQLAASQPKLAGSIAYAPVSDLTNRLGEIANDPQLSPIFPEFRQYLETYSPMAMADRMERPLFLFHAADDGNVPISQSNQLSQQVPNAANLTYVRVPTGNHYDSMINEGIPAALTWLRQMGKL